MPEWYYVVPRRKNRLLEDKRRLVVLLGLQPTKSRVLGDK